MLQYLFTFIISLSSAAGPECNRHLNDIQTCQRRNQNTLKRVMLGDFSMKLQLQLTAFTWEVTWCWSKWERCWNLEKISSAVGKASGLLFFLFWPSSPPVDGNGEMELRWISWDLRRRNATKKNCTASWKSSSRTLDMQLWLCKTSNCLRKITREINWQWIDETY